MRRRHAFSLVELLVVVGIIAVLIAILLPTLNKAREQGSRVVCASNMHQIAMATLAYATEDRQGTLPMPYYGLGTQFPHQPYEAITMDSLGQMNFSLGTLWAYLPGGPDSHRRVFNCPWDPDPRPLLHASPVAYQNFSYCFNIYLTHGEPGIDPCVRLSRVRHSSSKIVLAEPILAGGPSTDFTHLDDTSGLPVPWLSGRHSGFANEAFADGHVELIDPNVLDGSGANTNGVITIFNEAYRHYVDLFSDH